MMLGADDSDPAVYARSVFDPANRALLVARDVTSKYTRRGESEYDKMARYIATVSLAKAGNYIVFFPSFAMLGNVYDLFMSRYHDPDKQEIMVQSTSMSEQEREEFLSRFSDPSESTLLGFCVLGGIFSEGIDLKNDALIGAMIVGTGLPMVCIERDLMKRCYDEMGLDGFAYAYRYPGMNKVLQAAGRVIRTEEDRGVVALLDERFLERDYLRLFPREWEDYVICRVDDVMESLEQFWRN
jgi:Rad3-related DNA helicase